MLAKYLVGGRLDPPYYPTKTRPHFVGRAIEIPAKKHGVDRVIQDAFYMSHDLEFYAISIRTSKLTPEDYWNLYVDGLLVAKNVYCKDYEEGLYLQVAHPVPAGKEFVFEYHTANGENKSVEVMYHFLTNTNVELHLTGTIDFSKYPDPVPDPEDGDNPPPRNVGDIRLPVVWQPFTSVEEATKWAKDLGFVVDFHDKLPAANYVTEALALLLNSCSGFAEMIQKNRLTINVKDAQGANGYFNPPTGEVVVNKSYDFNNAQIIAQMEYDTGQKSSPHKLRTVIHEIGHWLHYHNVGADEFYRISNLDPDAYGSRTILSNRDATYIANNLCNYASSWFPIELIPEVFTAKITGVPIDPKIWEWYEQYGGFKCSGW